MRRLLRILMSVATALSLVLCAATMAAWVRSYLVRDSVWGPLPNQEVLSINTHRGGLLAALVTPVGPSAFSAPSHVEWQQSAPVNYDEVIAPQGSFVSRFGFVWDYFQNGAIALRQLACPYWFILLLTAILPAARLAGWRRRARRLRMRPGLCQHCGYDCRATPERCPECGKVPAGLPSNSDARNPADRSG